ncbi:MAG: dockerin type I domain-containing protein [Acholeplasma sp.]|nr:dockerin type I domain-containing protein [Acholeplasma sp.]
MKLSKIRLIILALVGLLAVFTFQPKPVQAGTSGWLIKGQENVTVIPGQTFTYTIRVENAENLSAYQLKLYYDDMLFEAIEIEKAVDMTGSFVSNIDTNGVIFANYTNTNTVSGNLALFKITFLANAYLQMGSHYLMEVDYDFTEIVMMDENYQTTVVDYVDYSFPEVSTAKIADVNMDGQITIVDALQIQLYLAGNIEFSEAQKKIGDVNFDGALTILDALQIQLFLAGLRGPFEEIVVPPVHVYQYFLACTYNNWQDAINYPVNKLMEIDIKDPAIMDMTAGFNVKNVYKNSVFVPLDETGDTVTHIVNGSEATFYSSRMFKIIETNEDLDFLRWLQSPESGPVMNLTPDTIFMPPYLAELNYDEYSKSNLVFLNGGIHDVYLVKLGNDQMGIGAIRREASHSSEQLMTMIIDMLSSYYTDGYPIESLNITRMMMDEYVVRAQLDWQSSHPEIFDPNMGIQGYYEQPEQDTEITFTITITVDYTLMETFTFTTMAYGHHGEIEYLEAIYFAGGMYGWDSVVGNPEFAMTQIDSTDPRFAAITAGLNNPYMVYAIDLYIPFDVYGFYVEYIDEDGSLKAFHESHLFKLLAVSNLNNHVWYPSEMSPDYINFTPDLIYIPNSMYYTNPDFFFGNIGLYSGGAYTIYFLISDNGIGIGAIENRMNTEQAMAAVKSSMFDYYDGADFSTLPWLAGNIKVDGETRATFTWTSSHPEIYDVSVSTKPIFNQPAEDTLVVITLTILVDGAYEDTLEFFYEVIGYQSN